MRRPLLSRWDVIVFGAFEAMAIAVLVFVSNGWQFEAFLAGALAIGGAGAAYLKFVPRGRAIAAGQPRPSAPWWVTFGVSIVTLLAAVVVFRVLGAGHAFGWFGMALGVSLAANRVVDRWWSFRAGVTAA